MLQTGRQHRAIADASAGPPQTKTLGIEEIAVVPIATLVSRQGGSVTIGYGQGECKTLAPGGAIDAYIVSTETGFSPLGSNGRFLSSDLDIPENEIRRLADWNRFENPRVTLAIFPSRRKDSCLRGLILAPSQGSECYRQFEARSFGRPYRDFYYNVTYEAIAYASGRWGARRIAISSLERFDNFREDIATCNAEALAHYCDAFPGIIEAFIFLRDGVISPEHLAGISRLNSEGETGQHRTISTETEHHSGHVLVHLDWSHDAQL